MRTALTFLIFIPLAAGFLVGLIVCPFVLGINIAYEFLADHVDGAYKRNLARRPERAAGNN